MLEIKDIHVYIGKTYVLKGMDFNIGQGEIVAVLGANGAGKSTTLKAISGLIRPKRGTITFQTDDGGKVLDICRTRAETIVAAGISHCPEGRQIFSRLSVRENLLIGAYLRKDKEEINKDLDWIRGTFPVLADRMDQGGGTLSGGEQMMLAIGRALMSRPKLLLLDEPSLGLAPLVVDRIFDIIEKINAEGMTVLLVEQNARMALELAHRAYVLETGKITLSGTGRELAENEEVQKAYLGAA